MQLLIKWIYGLGLLFLRRSSERLKGVWPDKAAQIVKLRTLDRENADLVERSYLQYRAQMYLRPFWVKVVLQCAALGLFLPLVTLGLVKSLRAGRAVSHGTLPTHHDKREVNAVLFFAHDRLLPDSLKSRFTIRKARSGMAFSFSDLQGVVSELVLRYPLHPFLWVTILLKLGKYRANLESGIKAYLVSSEYSFAGSYLTAWCEAHQILHINFMHGEKLFLIRDSYVAYHEFFVWDQHYVELLQSLRVRPSRFIIETPPSLSCFSSSIPVHEEGRKRLTYYLQAGTTEQLTHLNERLSLLRDRYDIVIRPHPRYGDWEEIRRCFPAFELESAEISICDSILRADLIASLYSTVLFQAFLSGKDVVIDDVSNPDLFKRLAELDFIMLSKEHILLSSLSEHDGRPLES